MFKIINLDQRNFDKNTCLKKAINILMTAIKW